MLVSFLFWTLAAGFKALALRHIELCFFFGGGGGQHLIVQAMEKNLHQITCFKMLATTLLPSVTARGIQWLNNGVNNMKNIKRKKDSQATYLPFQIQGHGKWPTVIASLMLVA